MENITIKKRNQIWLTVVERSRGETYTIAPRECQTEGCERAVTWIKEDGHLKPMGAPKGKVSDDSSRIFAKGCSLHMVVARKHAEQRLWVMRCSQLSRNVNSGHVRSQICSRHWMKFHWTLQTQWEKSSGLKDASSWADSSDFHFLWYCMALNG